jgi:hypothetical protein
MIAVRARARPLLFFLRMSRLRSVYSGLAAIFAVIAAAADAYQLRRDSSGEPVRWGNRAEFVLDERAAADLGEPQTYAAVQAALASFRDATTGVELSVRSGQTYGVGYSPAPGAPNQSEVVVLKEWPYDENAIAVTVVTVDTRSHQIVDADIALNAEGHTFRALAEAPRGYEFDDIQNTLTHELGHALGLAHNPAEPKAVMYPSASKGETSKRRLSSDDQAGLEVLYSKLTAPPSEGALPAVGCSSSGDVGQAWWLVFAVALALFRKRRAAAACAAAVVALVASPALAHGEADAPFASSPLVATAKVESARTVQWPNRPGIWVTELTLHLDECLKGNCPERVQVLVPGGRVGDLEQSVEGQSPPQVGDFLGVALREGASLTAPKKSEVKLFRLALARDAHAFEDALREAGIAPPSVSIPTSR